MQEPDTWAPPRNTDTEDPSFLTREELENEVVRLRAEVKSLQGRLVNLVDLEEDRW